jgi:hypothetical protein
MSRLFIKKEKKFSKTQKNLATNAKNSPFSPNLSTKIAAERKKHPAAHNKKPSAVALG